MTQPLTHTLSLTIGSKALAHSLLTIPGQFTTPSEVIRAAVLMELLQVEIPPDVTADALSSSIDVEVTEKQRDLLKAAVEKSASKIPVSEHSTRLLVALGFTE